MIRVRVDNERLLEDEPTNLPERTVIDLVVDDEGDELDGMEREALDAAILSAWCSVQEGRGRAAADVFADLRQR